MSKTEKSEPEANTQILGDYEIQVPYDRDDSAVTGEAWARLEGHLTLPDAIKRVREIYGDGEFKVFRIMKEAKVMREESVNKLKLVVK